MADLDRDGRLDVVSATETGLMVRLGGSGAVALDAEPRQEDVVIADFNGDGAPDLAVADYWNSRGLIYINRGNGTRTRQRARRSREVLAVETADFNRDGKADVVFEEHSIPNWKLLSSECPLARAMAPLSPRPAWTRPFLLESAPGEGCGDFDRDGKPDVAARGSRSGYGNGGYGTPARVVSDESNEGFGRIAVGDLDEDGRSDLITIGLDRLQVWLALPVGGFADSAPRIRPHGSRTTASSTTSAIGDMNLDGHADVITNEADILYGDGTGALTLERAVGIRMDR